jgi:sulfotransferase
MTQFVCLSGMPRSGSTLLSSILSQNPIIHAEGNSAVCQLMWDMHISCTKHVDEQIGATNREYTIRDLVVQIPNTYYKNVEIGTKIIIDKCRAWTRPTNIEILKKYIDPNVKIIVMERSITDVIKSFCKIYKKNNWPDDIICKALNDMLLPETEPIMFPIKGIQSAKAVCKDSPNTFLFIHYDDLIENAPDVINRIYAFCGWKPFQHTFTDIVNKHPENDKFYGLNGFHDIRPIIGREENIMVLPQDIMKKCIEIDKYCGYL